MTNYDLINGFVNYNYTDCDASHLYIEGDELFNYKTVIAIRLENGNIILNAHYYSMTTAKNQNYIRSCSRNSEIYEIENPYVFYEIKNLKNDKQKLAKINSYYKKLKTSILTEDKKIIERFLNNKKTGQNDRLKITKEGLFNKYLNEKIAYIDDEGYLVFNKNYFNKHTINYIEKDERAIFIDENVFYDYNELDYFSKISFRMNLKRGA